MNNKEYGENFQSHLLEQYKLYVNTTIEVSNKRIQTNRFYVSLLSILFTFISFAYKFSSNNFNYIVVCFIGILLCIVWYSNIRSYKQLNKLKFKVIHEIEALLPFSCFIREWEIEEETSNYLRLTIIEKYVPIIMAILYISLLLNLILFQ